MIQDNFARHTDHEIINDEQFEEMRDLLEEDFADLVQSYITDSQNRLLQLRTAQANNDNANGFEVAHALKGASATLGATHLAAISSQLQEVCRSNTISQHADTIEQAAIALQLVEQEIHQRLGQ